MTTARKLSTGQWELAGRMETALGVLAFIG
jgi:hypothetical protein